MKKPSEEERLLLEEGLAIVSAAVRTYAGRFPGVRADELRSAGNEACVLARNGYDPAKGSFGDYAKPRIYGAVIDAGFAANGWRRRGLDLLRALRRRSSVAADIPRLSLSEMVAEKAVSPIESLQARAATFVAALLEGDPPHEEDAIVERMQYARSVQALAEAIDKLTPRERTVILGLFYENKTYEALAAELGTSDKTIQRTAISAKATLHRSLAALGIRGAPNPVDLG